MGKVKNPVCGRCGQPGYRKDHPACERAERTERENARKARLRRENGPAYYVERRAKDAKLPVEASVMLERRPCDVCGAEAPEEPGHNNAYVRADTGAVTGTVCQRCTKTLGTWDYNAERVRAALALMTSETDHRASTPKR
ncbi:hypothetical protein [Streptomyces erythrochromogenes]|uniref:hypothetical protein n=1 Tax=Streptomyces erythrochromogenes TaxID=285574 RepID=UPI0037D24C89